MKHGRKNIGISVNIYLFMNFTFYAQPLVAVPLQQVVQRSCWFRTVDLSFLHATVEVIELWWLENNDANTPQGKVAVLVHHFDHCVQHCVSNLFSL